MNSQACELEMGTFGGVRPLSVSVSSVPLSAVKYLTFLNDGVIVIYEYLSVRDTSSNPYTITTFDVFAPIRQ